jgi:2-polyprenyl-3-methyl-5-hydroxy-6-metoxy-1,4-benzoquinol methylase
VLSLEVIEHLYDPHAFAYRAFELLEDGGSLIMSTPCFSTTITELELKQLERLRELLNERHAERTAPVVKSVSRSRISSDSRT